MPDLTLADVKLHYEVQGNGPPLLLLAGMLSDSASWGGVLPLLTQNFTVVRTDNRGTGRTVPVDAPASVQTYAEDGIAVMQHLGFKKFHLAGHSMGGLAAMEVAHRVPDKVSSLSILTSAPVRVPRTTAVFDALRDIRQAPEGEVLWLRALYPWIFRPAFFSNPAAIQTALAAALGYPYAQSLGAMTKQIEVLRSYRPTVRASDIQCPTLTLFAADDILIPEEVARDAFASINDVTQITVPDAGHSIHWDAPEAVAEHITAFALAHPCS